MTEFIHALQQEFIRNKELTLEQAIEQEMLTPLEQEAIRKGRMFLTGNVLINLRELKHPTLLATYETNLYPQRALHLEIDKLLGLESK